MRAEIERGVATLKRMYPCVSPTLYRPPMGLKNPTLARLQQQLGLRVAAWSLHAGDTRSRTGESIAARVLQRIRGGDIVVFHDGHDLPGKSRRHAVVDALERILPEIARRGLQPVTVSELIAD